MVASLGDAGTWIRDEDLRAALHLLHASRSVAVVGTMLSGRVALAAGLAAAAKRPRISVLYYFQPDSPRRVESAGVVIEEAPPSVLELRSVAGSSVPYSDWAQLADTPAPLGGLLTLDGDSWVLTDPGDVRLM